MKFIIYDVFYLRKILITIMEETNNEIFIINLDDDLMPLFNSYKKNLTIFLKNNFLLNKHYIMKSYGIKKKGGQNKIKYLLTQECFELFKNTFNLKHRYLTKINDNVTHINILMSLENQTIGFIENSFKDVIKTKRQKSFNNYKVDLYFEDYKLVIECDECDHLDRDPIKEKEREDYILSTGNSIIRYNPNDKLFDLSLVLREIHKFILNFDKHTKLIKVKFE